MAKKKIITFFLIFCFILSACTSPVNINNNEEGAGNPGDDEAAPGAQVTANAEDSEDITDNSDTSNVSGAEAPSENSDTSDSLGNSSASDEFDLEDTSDVTILEDYTGGNVKITDADLGSTTFSVKESRSATVSETFTMDGPEKSIELWDEKRNVTWKLTVPEGALLSDTEIKMTLLYNLSGSESTGTLDCGVMLEPDGLQFVKPATLTADGDYEHAFAYSAKHDGSNLDIAFAELKDSDIAIQVSHFSMYALKQMTQAEFDKLVKTEISKAEAILKEAIEEAKLVEKEPITIIPLPTWSKCLLHDEESEKTQKAYEELDVLYERLASPEYSVLKKMIESLATISQCHGKTKQPYEKYWNKLSYRLYRKAIKVLKEYGSNKETIVPAINISMRLLKDSSWNSEVTDEMVQGAFRMAGRYAIQASEAYLNDIVKYHDYCSMSAVWSLARAGSVFNNEEYKNSSVNFERLVAAMKFKFEFDGKIIGYSNNGKHTYTYTVDAKIPDIKDQVTDGHKVVCMGSGKISDFVSTDSSHMKAVLPAEFEVASFLDFHYPCEDESTIVLIDKPAPLSMTYYVDDSKEKKLEMSVFKYSWMEFFAPHLSEEGEGYHIEIKMINGQASHKLDMTNSLDYGKIEYKFNLEHIPK